LRHRKLERAALEAIKLIQVKIEVQAEVVSLCKAATHAANGIAGEV
jgi:hypothetical protein